MPTTILEIKKVENNLKFKFKKQYNFRGKRERGEWVSGRGDKFRGYIH